MLDASTTLPLHWTADPALPADPASAAAQPAPQPPFVPLPSHVRVAMRASPLALVRALYDAQAEALATAAEVLGGQPALGRHYRLVADLRRGRLTDGQLVREVRRVHDLLSLRHVGDPGRDESGHFALIELESEFVHDLCRLTDAVSALLADLRREAARRAEQAQRPTVVVRQGAGAARAEEAREVLPTARVSRTAEIARARRTSERLFPRPDAA